MTAKSRLILFALSLAFLPHLLRADVLIDKDWLSSGEDWYLKEKSVKPIDVDIYGAVHYLRLHNPRNYLEVFNDNFEVIGEQEIGQYLSYSYVSLFDCKNNLVANYGAKYFSSDKPADEHEIYKEKSGDLFWQMPTNPKLIRRVCTIGQPE